MTCNTLVERNKRHRVQNHAATRHHNIPKAAKDYDAKSGSETFPSSTLASSYITEMKSLRGPLLKSWFPGTVVGVDRDEGINDGGDEGCVLRRTRYS